MQLPLAVLPSTQSGGLLSRLDPRARLAWMVAIFVVSVAIWEPMTLTALAAVTLATAHLAGMLRLMFRSFLGLTVVIALIVLVDVAYYGIVIGALAGLKFLIAVAAFSIFFTTTPPEEFADAIVSMGLSDDVAFTISAGARFVPTVMREASEILDAYQARGMGGSGRLFDRLRLTAGILVPLVVATVSRSLRLAEAMEARGYGAVARRTRLRELRMRAIDYAVVIASIALTIVTIVVAR